MEVGKFPAALLEKILAKVDISDPRVVVGPRVGEDTAVLKTGGSLLVAKSDPVTFATDRIGPKWFLAPCWCRNGSLRTMLRRCSTRSWKPAAHSMSPWWEDIAR